MPSHVTNVLLVVDDANSRRGLRERLSKEGWDVAEAPDGDAALQALDSERFALIYLDLRTAEFSSVHVIRYIEATRTEPAVLLMPAYPGAPPPPGLCTVEADVPLGTTPDTIAALCRQLLIVAGLDPDARPPHASGTMAATVIPIERKAKG